MPATETELARCPIFHDLSPAECRGILEMAKHESYGTGETILREGKSTQILWVILRGTCRVVKLGKGNLEQQLAVLEPCTVFGEMSFFNPAPHSASVIAASDVEVLRLDRAAYDRLDPKVATRIALNTVKVLAERLRRMDDWTCELVDRPEAAGHREEWREFRSKLYSDWVF